MKEEYKMGDIDVEKARIEIKEGRLDRALLILANCVVAAAVVGSNKSELYYLLGNVYRKKGDFPTAMNFYNKAIEEDPESPAVEARRVLKGIMSFYNKDKYNH
jgi:tetratricopeptide (TPR) repeat protein